MKALKLIFVAILVALTSMLAVSCVTVEYTAEVPSEKEAVIEKLENAGYEVTESASIPENATAVITAYRQTDGGYDGIIIVWFIDNDSAAEYVNDWVDSRYDVKKTYGNLACYGTNQAILDLEKPTE